MAITESEMLIKFLCHLEKEIGYCIVGDVRRLPEDTSKDIDFIIRDADRKRIPSILEEFCRSHECRFIQFLRHESIAVYYVISWLGVDGFNFLQLDFCSDYLRYARPLLTANELLLDVKRIPSCDTEVQLVVPAPRKAFIYYVLKRIDKRLFSGENGSYLSEVYKLDPNGCREEMLRFWPCTVVDDLERSASECRWESVIDHVSRYQEEIVLRKSGSVVPRLMEFARVIARIIRPTGLVVEIQGGDDECQTRISEMLRVGLLRGFRNSLVAADLHLHDRWWRVVRSTLLITKRNFFNCFLPRIGFCLTGRKGGALEVVRINKSRYEILYDSTVSPEVMVMGVYFRLGDFILQFMEKRVNRRLGLRR